MPDQNTQQESLVVNNPDWDGINDDCPECGSTKFESVNYDTTIYEDGKDVNDRWYKQGNLLTKCLSCGEILRKHAAYEILEDTETATQETSDTSSETPHQ
jgi:predicted  nucleic acid-binding Zn-ribbon protein